MTKSKYYIVTFPATSLKNPLATLAGNVIGSIDHVFEIFGLYAEETYGKSPLQILQTTLNNESLFGADILESIPCDNEANGGQSIKASKLENRRSETTKTEDAKMDTSSDKDTEMEVSTTNGTETEVATTKDVKMEIGTDETVESEAITAKSADKKIIVKEESKVPETEERIKDLVGRNLVKIRSMSVIKESKSIGIELNMDLSFGLYGVIPTKSEQWHGSPATKSEQHFGLSEMKTPVKGEKKNKSPIGSALNPTKPGVTFLFPDESLPFEEHLDSKFRVFLAKRLSSILSSRKIYMEQLCNCFQSFLKPVRVLGNTISNISFVVENLPMAKEAYLTDELLKMRADLLNKAHDMSGKMESLVENAKNNVDISERSLKEIIALEKERGPTLSTAGESVPKYEDMLIFEKTLKEICKEVDAKAVLEDKMWLNVFPFYSDFEWLIKHFIKFLIITGLLEPRK